MVNVQFDLKSDKGNLTSIRAKFYFQHERFVYSLGSENRIYPDLWDFQKQRPIKLTKELRKKYSRTKYKVDTRLQNITRRIENVTRFIEQYISNKEIQDENIDFKELKKELNTRYSPHRIKSDRVKNKMEFNEFYAAFAKGITEGTRTYTNDKGVKTIYPKSTAKTYRETKTQIDNYQEDRGVTLKWSSIDMDFYDDFVDYFLDRDYKPNSIGKQIKCLKKIMNQGLEEDMHTNVNHTKKEFKTIKVDTYSIALTEKELESIYNLDLSNEPALDLARDVFMIGAYTSLRYSDASRIKPHNVGDVIEIITKKTNKRVKIPIRMELRQILNKYNNTIPSTTPQGINKHIKEVGKLAGIDNIVTYRETIGRKTLTREVPKYQLIATHTARRSGATIMYKNGVPILDIMNVTAHSSEKTLMKYLKVTADDTVERTKDNPFFVGKPVLKKVM